jgi:hypothetical protein
MRSVSKWLWSSTLVRGIRRSLKARGGVAHGFDNLLQVILGYSEILQQHADLPEPSRACCFRTWPGCQ